MANSPSQINGFEKIQNMKKALFFSCFLLITWSKAMCQPIVSNVSYNSSVDLFGLFEISFNMGAYSNPYNPDTIAAYAIFYSPDNTTTIVNAFYYEDYSFYCFDGYEKVADSMNNVGWRIRFTPTCVGNWYFNIIAKDVNGMCIMPLQERSYFFTCNPTNNAKGFISKANKRYLKRTVVEDGVTKNKAFFPIGPNIAWYSCKDYGYWEKPRGIYDYERYIDSLNSNGNYMRIWLNRYQYLNLYGPEYTQGSTVYFDSTLNQKDAAELDHIVTYAAQHNISLIMCIFTYGDFLETNCSEPGDPSVWSNNPYNSLPLSICNFFDNPAAIKISKNLIRYIVSRWGYATNIVCWELWNEVNQLCYGFKPFNKYVVDWHKEMAVYVDSIDPHQHMVSSSMGVCSTSETIPLYKEFFGPLDLAQQHNYQNIQKAKSAEQISYILYKKGLSSWTDYPQKPFFMGEFGFGQSSGTPSYQEKDPYGIDLHNSLWSSLFSGSMGPGAFWFWHYVDNKGLFYLFQPMLTFCDSLSIPSDSFRPYTTGVVNENNHRTLDFPNSLETYYLKNATEDTIYGWSQDTAFCYQSLRWLTDSVRPVGDETGGAWHFVNGAVFDSLGYVYTLDPLKKPHPSSNSNIISIHIDSIPLGEQYTVVWYNSETGLRYNNSSSTVVVQQDTYGARFINIEFPSFIRDLQNNLIGNTFGDAVFVITKNPVK